MIERLTIEENAPVSLAVTITRTGSTATATTTAAHGYSTLDYVTVEGATPAGYNGKIKITVTAPTTFTYPVSSGLTTPATGAITVTYTSDPQGNRKIGWNTFAEVAAEAMPIRADERLAAAAIPALASSTQYRFRVQTRADLTDQMRVRWTPRWPPNMQEHVLEITGLLPEDDGRRYMLIEAVE